jgi:hypothetical protein
MNTDSVQSRNCTVVRYLYIQRAFLKYFYYYLQSTYSLVFAQIPGWESAGIVYLQFISVDTAVNTLLQNRDINTLGYEITIFCYH